MDPPEAKRVCRRNSQNGIICEVINPTKLTVVNLVEQILVTCPDEPQTLLIRKANPRRTAILASYQFGTEEFPIVRVIGEYQYITKEELAFKIINDPDLGKTIDEDYSVLFHRLLEYHRAKLTGHLIFRKVLQLLKKEKDGDSLSYWGEIYEVKPELMMYLYTRILSSPVQILKDLHKIEEDVFRYYIFYQDEVAWKFMEEMIPNLWSDMPTPTAPDSPTSSISDD